MGLSYGPSILLLDIYPEELKARSQRDICIPVFVVALLTIAEGWKPPKFLLTDEWINKMWFVHTKEYYSAIKKEILTHTKTWMNLEDIRLSKISQSQKDAV